MEFQSQALKIQSQALNFQSQALSFQSLRLIFQSLGLFLPGAEGRGAGLGWKKREREKGIKNFRTACGRLRGEGRKTCGMFVGDARERAARGEGGLVLQLVLHGDDYAHVLDVGRVRVAVLDGE
ncbi:MAG: hypothetical protein SPI56_09145, partial [Alloprevotella sp.]|nr:hypothetical protein [Alloprevotella sp.]